FNQPVTEWQEHSGAVTGTSLKVQYAWANGAANTTRQTGITFPNGTALSIAYDSALADALSRPDALKESSTTLASFAFLGLDTLIRQRYAAASDPAPTMQDGGTGDAGDIYTGPDRFGRLVPTTWATGSSDQIDTCYGRNRVGGV